jgi:DNA-binding MarR family transcriptional regulator
MNRARQKELRPFDISPRQATILFILNRQINTLSQQITRMEKNGLVRKVRETPKSALISFELTEKGTEIYNKSVETSSVEQIMSVLTEEERQQLISLLKKIAAAAEM